VNTDEALFKRSSRCSNSDLKNCNFPNVELNFLPVTDLLTILENVFTDVNFRGQYIHPKNIVFIMSYTDSCELCGDVILITAVLRQYKM